MVYSRSCGFMKLGAIGLAQKEIKNVSEIDSQPRIICKFLFRKKNSVNVNVLNREMHTAAHNV